MLENPKYFFCLLVELVTNITLTIACHTNVYKQPKQECPNVSNPYQPKNWR